MKRPLALVGVAAALAACGGGGVDELTIDGVWARPTPGGATNGVVYMTITSPIDDAVIAAAVSPSVAESATLHQSSVDHDHGGGGHHEAPAGDMVTMTDTNRLELPADEAIALKPGGLHVMLEQLPERLEVGQEFQMVLTLEQAGETDVTVVVAENPPG